jgi:gamma-glutamyl phosphate reductase
MAVRAREASRKLQAMTTQDRVAMLHKIADSLVANEAAILQENAKVSNSGGHLRNTSDLVQATLLPSSTLLVQSQRLKCVSKHCNSSLVQS